MFNSEMNIILADFDNLIGIAIFIFIALGSLAEKIKKGQKPKKPTGKPRPNARADGRVDQTAKPRPSATTRPTVQPTAQRNLPSYARKASQAQRSGQPQSKPTVQPRPTAKPRPTMQPNRAQVPREAQPRPVAKPQQRPAARPKAVAPKPAQVKPVAANRAVNAGKPGTSSHCHDTKSRDKLMTTQKAMQTKNRSGYKIQATSAKASSSDFLHRIVKTDNELIRAIIYAEIFNKPVSMREDSMY
ncbi:MAG: hypothetical protein JEZ07_07775 [Phycisphaerae bacterium]|nr:hypothetical protein [Phycisphaerae bacterium]